MKELDYISIIHKELVGELSDTESVQLQEWKADNEDNLATYHDTVEIWKLTSNYTPPKLEINVSRAIEDQLSRIRQESKQEEVSTAKVVRLRPTQWAMRIAAVLVFVLSATFVFQSMNSGETYTAGNDIKFVQLSDGSNIWLDKNSTLTIHNSFGDTQRQVALEGRAFFDIARDEARPFLIEANHVDVQVLGTSFTVDANDNTPMVSVKSGRVEVKADAETKIITKGQQLEATISGSLTESDVDMDTAFDWTNGDLSFKDAPLTKVLADLGNHFNVDFKYRGGVDLDECPFTSLSLADTSLDDVLDILALTYDMNIVKKSEKEIKLSRIKCRK